jgi:large subunit ribosomal protein L18
MATLTQKKQQGRLRRQARARKKIHGTPERPRLAVFRSNKHIVAQVIDDTTGTTLAAASSHEGAVKSAGATGNSATSAKIGALVAERAKAAGISKVVFDRGGFIYHGRIAAVADAARAAGLEF